MVRTTVFPQCAVILALFHGLPFHDDTPDPSAARIAVTSEIAGSIWLVALLQVGGGYAVAAYFDAADDITPESRALIEASQDTNISISLVIAILFFVVDAVVDENPGIAFAVGTSKSSSTVCLVYIY